MKQDIENFIKNYKCQLRKLVYVKTRWPIILTDTSSAAFDKTAMDIMGPLMPTKAGHNYILTVQDLLTKFLVVIPLEQTTVIHITFY